MKENQSPIKIMPLYLLESFWSLRYHSKILLRDQIVAFLDTKIRNSQIDPDL